MIRKQDGFTLVELMITMVIFVFVLAAASNIFTGLLTQFKQQSKIAETNIEGIVGLELLRHDIEKAGHGLPFDLDGATYNEVLAGQPGALYNDAPNAEPRAIVLDDNASPTPDILVIKATNIATSETSQLWTYVSNTGITNTIATWRHAATDNIIDEANMDNGSRVTVILPVSGMRQNVLLSAGNFFTVFDTVPPPAAVPDIPDAFDPAINSYESYLIYGIDPDTDPVMPFNRADYLISAANVPERCNDNAALPTGVLVKSVISHATRLRGLTLPLLDCVADMQVAFMIDHDDNPATANIASDMSGLDAEQIRNRLKEVRVYILAHEGQRDNTYTSPAVLDTYDPAVGTFAIPAAVRNYRWRIYTIITKPYNVWP